MKILNSILRFLGLRSKPLDEGATKTHKGLEVIDSEDNVVHEGASLQTDSANSQNPSILFEGEDDSSKQTDAPLTDAPLQKKEPEISQPKPSDNDQMSVDELVALLCGTIVGWEERKEELMLLPQAELIKFMSNECKQLVFATGAERISEDKTFDIKRHKVVEPKGRLIKPNTPITEFVDDGVVYKGDVLIKAKVKVV